MKLQFSLNGEGQPPQLWVVRAKVKEGLNQLFSVDLLLASSQQGLAADQYVGHGAEFKVLDSAGSAVLAQWQGMVSEMGSARATWSGKDLFAYRVQVRPSLWKLAYTARSRVFTDLTRPEAVKQALSKGGLNSFEIEPLQNTGAHPKLEQIIQYKETDLDFVLRIMRLEGLSFFYLPVGGDLQFSSQSNPSDFFRITDYHPMLKEQSSPVSLSYKPSSGLVANSPHADALSWRSRAVPGSLAVQSHAATNVHQTYKPTSGGNSIAGGLNSKVFLYQDTTARQHMNQNWSPQDFADKMTKLRAEELAAWSEEGEGTSNHIAVRPCLHLQFTPNPLSQQAAQYQVTSATHRWSIAPRSEGDAAYTNSFLLAKKGAPIRPAFITPWPPRPI